MPEIVEKPFLFQLDLLSNPDSVVGDRDGHWYCEGVFMRFIRWLTWGESRRLKSIGESFITALDNLERQQKGFNNINSWLQLGKKVTEQIGPGDLQVEIMRRLFAMQYRYETPSQGTIDSLAELTQIASQWKSDQKHLDRNDLSEHDLKQLQILSENYPDLCELILHNKALRESCFLWMIQNKNLIAPFAEFPGTAQLLTECLIARRIGWVAKETLEITGVGANKTLSLPFKAVEDGKVVSRKYSILKLDQELHFRGNLVCTIHKMFLDFKNKDFVLGHFEFFKDGFNNWDLINWGIFTVDENGNQGCIPLNLEQEKWWEEVPVMETLSVHEAIDRYGDEIDGDSWAISVVATRKHLHLDVDETHAHLEIAFPVKDDEGETIEYRVLNPGKFITENPSSLFSLIKLVCNTVTALITSHDPNRVETGRQRTLYTEVVKPVDGAWFLQTQIKPDIEKTRAGNFAFQLLDQNCAEWVQKLMNALLEQIGKEKANFFKVKLLNTNPIGIAGYILKPVRIFPSWAQNSLLRALLLLFAPWRGKQIEIDGQNQIIRFFGSEAWNNLTIYCPSYLFIQQEVHGNFLPKGRKPPFLKESLNEHAN